SLVAHQPPLVRELPRQAGAREQRFAHLLCGEPKVEETQAAAAAPAAAAGNSALMERVERLEQQIQALTEAVEALKARLP
ncbi:YceH family protein, partial [Thiohalocapsa halophila]